MPAAEKAGRQSGAIAGKVLFRLFQRIIVSLKQINRLKRAEVSAPAAPAAPSEDVLLLREIRDSLKK